MERPHPSRLDPSSAAYDAVLDAHRRAVASAGAGYLDPTSGLFVLTATEHLRRGSCCDRGCRHCPWVGSSGDDEVTYDERPQ